MKQSDLRAILRMSAGSDRLLQTGAFGQGLWPVEDEVGQFLAHVIRFFDLKSGIEVGSGVGYSTLWLGMAFRENAGHLISFEYFLPKVRQWELHMDRIFGPDYSDVVNIVPSDVLRWIPRQRRSSLDFVFFDQRKGDYLSHLQQLLPLLKKGAFICADNVDSHPDETANYRSFLQKDRRFETCTFHLGAGLEVSRFTSGN